MSSFLAPIHEHLFWKIQKVNERASLLVTAALSRWGSEDEEAEWMAWDDCGKPLGPTTRLADVIDMNDIHGWLLKRITIVECREAAFFAYLADKVGNEAYELAKEVYQKDGLRVGLEERERVGVDCSPSQLYHSLYRYILNGMPCDDIDVVLEESDKVFRWKKTVVPQRASWRRTAVDMEKMEEVYATWVKAFFSAFEPEFKVTDERRGEERYLTFEKTI